MTYRSPLSSSFQPQYFLHLSCHHQPIKVLLADLQSKTYPYQSEFELGYRSTIIAVIITNAMKQEQHEEKNLVYLSFFSRNVLTVDNDEGGRKFETVLWPSSAWQWEACPSVQLGILNVANVRLLSMVLSKMTSIRRRNVQKHSQCELLKSFNGLNEKTLPLLHAAHTLRHYTLIVVVLSAL